MMTDEFAANDWIERLAQALAALAEAQEPYRDELAPQHQQSLLDEMEKLLGKPLDYPPYELFGFYSRAHSQGVTLRNITPLFVPHWLKRGPLWLPTPC